MLLQHIYAYKWESLGSVADSVYVTVMFMYNKYVSND